MFEIKVSKEIKDACPVFAGAAVYAAVKNTAYSEGLWREINAFTEQLTSTTQMEDIKHQPVIFATREAYKRCGKDPGRYRPSAEALRRRLMRGIPLYQIDTLVDLINLCLFVQDIRSVVLTRTKYKVRTLNSVSAKLENRLKVSDAGC